MQWAVGTVRVQSVSLLSAIAALLLLAPRVPAAPRPITQGQLDEADAGVVGLVAAGRVICSGTLVAPRVVLTAGHCLVSSTVSAVLFGPDLERGRLVAVVHARIHPDLDATTLRDDLGLLLLAEPQTVNPWSLLASPLDASFAGKTVRLVGFGQTSPDDAGAARKRQGTATLSSFTADDFELHAAPSLTCGGDSGGPAFVTAGGAEVLAGVISSGDAACAVFSRAVRVDLHRAFVADFIAATAPGAAGAGERCYYAAHCASDRCRFPADAPTVGYCAATCRDDGDCASGMVCDETECRYRPPSPGALGTTCASYTECDSLLCASGSCSVVCEPATSSCPDGFVCRADDEQAELHACFAVLSGGCAVAAPGAAAIPLVLLVLWRLTARRTACRACAAAGSRTCSCG